MPMYFPDLESVQGCVNSMRQNEGSAQYKGVYPENEKQLPQARRELAVYFRETWGDEVQAMEIELAVSEENYDELMMNEVRKLFRKSIVDDIGIVTVK